MVCTVEFDPINAAIRLACAVKRSSRPPLTRRTGIARVAQPLPQWLLRARPGEPQARGEPLHAVLPAGVGIARVRRKGREQWLVEPTREERVEAVALDRCRELVVAVATSSTLGRVVDAGRAAHQHQPVDAFGMGDGRVQHHPGPHRIAHEGGLVVEEREVGRGLPEVGPYVRGEAVTGRVDRNDPVASGEGRRQ